MVNKQIPAEVLQVAETLEKGGYEAYLVGGCVRDVLLGKKPKDWDITSNATPEQIQGLFEETFYENTYGTVGVVTGTTAGFALCDCPPVIEEFVVFAVEAAKDDTDTSGFLDAPFTYLFTNGAVVIGTC